MNGFVGIIRGLRKKPDLPKLAGSSNPEARPFRVVQHYLKGYPFVALASELRRGPLTPDMAWLSGPLTKTLGPALNGMVVKTALKCHSNAPSRKGLTENMRDSILPSLPIRNPFSNCLFPWSGGHYPTLSPLIPLLLGSPQNPFGSAGDLQGIQKTCQLVLGWLQQNPRRSASSLADASLSSA